MYNNDGYLKTQKTQFENRMRIKITDEVWELITSKFEKTDFGFTHYSVNKRLSKTLANRENGKKGGRPPKNPNNPTSKPKKTHLLERERERESERENIKKINKKNADLGYFQNRQNVNEIFAKFLGVQKSPKSEIQIEAIVKKLESFPSDEIRIESLEASIRAGYSDVYLPKSENSKSSTTEKPSSIWVDGKEHKPQKVGDGWVYPTIIAVEINREANTALLSDGSIQPLGQQQKGFKSAEFKFIKKGLIQ